MQDPLKQGLKRTVEFPIRIWFLIRMQDPLKQGLKLKLLWIDSPEAAYSNARSTKTRIETKHIIFTGKSTV